jgi:hypothetical protein
MKCDKIINFIGNLAAWMVVGTFMVFLPLFYTYLIMRNKVDDNT